MKRSTTGSSQHTSAACRGRTICVRCWSPVTRAKRSTPRRSRGGYRALSPRSFRRRLAHGLDMVNDGEESKRSWSTYARERLGGHEQRPRAAGAVSHSHLRRDAVDFPEYFETMGPGRGPNTRGGITSSGAIPRADACVAPLTYVGQDVLQRDIDNLKAALVGSARQEGFMSAVSPGTIEHWLRNDYYKTPRSTCTRSPRPCAWSTRQSSTPASCCRSTTRTSRMRWQMHPEMDVAAYRKHAALRIEALNHGLRNIAPEMVRLHVCWGSYHGPHKYDIEMSDIIDVVLKTRCQGFAVEAANPRHAHDWRAWKETGVPDGKVLIPGVVGHDSDFIESPELVAERIERYATIAGRENVIAGTDCGLGPRVGHPQIAWAKFDALVEGARIASKRLWT